MKLRNKFFVVFSVAIIIFIIISMFIQYYFIVPATLKIEKLEACANLQRCISAIRNEEEHLSVLAEEWGERNDTLTFINDHNKKFIKSNFNLSTFKNANLYAILLYNSSKSLIWAGEYKLGENNYTEFRDINAIFGMKLSNLIIKNNLISGLLCTNKGMYIIASNSILNSDGNGTVGGHIVIVKKLNNDFIQEIRNRVSLNVTLKKVIKGKQITNKPSFTLDDSRDILSSKIYLPTLNNESYILLHINIPRGIFSSSLRILNYVQIFICLLALILFLILLLIFRKMVTQPLSDLSEYIVELKDDYNLNTIPYINRKDEIGTLAREFDILLNRFDTINQNLENLVEERTDEMKKSHEEMIFRLVISAEKRDSGTGNHIKRIMKMTTLFADKLGMPADISEMYGLASSMHDIGKIGISDSILLKPGKFTDEEYDVMKSHSTIGASILGGSKIKLLNIAKEIALGHHEQWDGKGYPIHLKGKNIPISARIVSIVDVFDALYTKRLYKRAWNLSEILSYLVEKRGTQFDPELVDLFLVNISEFQSIIESYNS
jgi:response regulator RpfG family c-di-GMP phosphodiesterase/sensor domain CHASE-containing protein